MTQHTTCMNYIGDQHVISPVGHSRCQRSPEDCTKAAEASDNGTQQRCHSQIVNNDLHRAHSHAMSTYPCNEHIPASPVLAPFQIRRS